MEVLVDGSRNAAPQKYQLTMFGNIAVTRPGTKAPLTVNSAQSRVLLALLAASPAHRLTREDMLVALWPDGVEPSASALRVALKRARGVFEPDGIEVIQTASQWYELSPLWIEVDIDRWLSGVRSAERLRSADPSAALAAYSEASSLWMGEPFFGVVGVEAVEVTRRSLLATRVNVTLHELELLIELDPPTAAYRAASMVSIAPIREDLVKTGMNALWRANQRTEAVAMGASFRERLRDDLGLSPTDEFLSIERRVLQPTPKESAARSVAQGNAPWANQTIPARSPQTVKHQQDGKRADFTDLAALLTEAELAEADGKPEIANDLLWCVVTESDPVTEVELMIRAAYSGAGHAGRVGGDFERRRRLQVVLDRMGSHALRDEVLADFALESANCGHALDVEVQAEVLAITQRPESPGHMLAYRWLAADRHMYGKASLDDAVYLASLGSLDGGVTAHQHAAGLAVAVTLGTAFGALDLAEKWASEMEYQGAHNRHPRGRWQALAFQGVIAEMVGRTDRSDDYAKRAYEFGTEVGIADAERTFGMLFFARAYRGGSIAAFAPLLASVEAQYQYPLWTMCRALAEWQSGNEHVARQLFQAGTDGVLGRVDRFTTPTLGIAAQVACALGAVKEAVLFDRSLAQVQEPFLMLGYGGPCIAHKGAIRAEVAQLVGNNVDASCLLEDAIAECTKMGAAGMLSELTRMRQGLV